MRGVVRWALRRRLGGRGHQASPPLGYLSGIVDGRDGWEHLVTEETYEQGLRDHTGHFTALCGLRILAASMGPPHRSTVSP